MAFFNPIQIIATLFLALVALPLAFLAMITTWLAAWILLTRLFFVYAELAWEMVHYTVWDRWQAGGQYVESPLTSARSSRPVSPTMVAAACSPFSGSPPRSPEFSSLKGASRSRSRRRTGSISSATGSITAGGSGPRVAFSGASLLEPNPNAWQRDFEGLGGWRIQQVGDGDATDENAWSSLNSRLELPPEQHHHHHQHHRHHSRAHTHAGAFANNYTIAQPPRSGARSGPHSPERLLIPRSPGASRTPSRVRVEPFTNLERNDSYFPLLASTSIKNIVA